MSATVARRSRRAMISGMLASVAATPKPCWSGESSTTQEVLFEDRFSGVETALPDGSKKLYPDRSKWSFTFWPGSVWPSSYGNGTNWLESNGECQTYVTPFTRISIPAGVGAYDPFTIEADGLHITAALLTQGQQQAYRVGGFRRFGSGMLSTFPNFSFQYGKVEIVAKLPAARGTWPAFWLLPVERIWPPEIDILEAMPWGTRTRV